MSSVTINCENGCLFDVVAGETPLSLLCSMLVRGFINTRPSTVSTTQWTYRREFDTLQPLPSDPTEHVDIAKAHPDIVASMTARLQQLEPSFYSNNETGTDSPACASAPNGMPCACYLALPGNYWDGYFGPYQV